MILGNFATCLHERHETMTGRMNWKGQEDKMVGEKRIQDLEMWSRHKEEKKKKEEKFWLIQLDGDKIT